MVASRPAKVLGKIETTVGADGKFPHLSLRENGV
jgi:hypothetical protein